MKPYLPYPPNLPIYLSIRFVDHLIHHIWKRNGAFVRSIVIHRIGFGFGRGGGGGGEVAALWIFYVFYVFLFLGLGVEEMHGWWVE